MKSVSDKLIRTTLAVCVLASNFSPVLAGDWFRPRPQTSVECLADRIDRLEHHIEEYGSVVAKKPDVWGESRLARHRRDFEEVMAGQLKTFESTINATLSRSDQSFLANAFSLSAAIGGDGGGPTNPAIAIAAQTSGVGATATGDAITVPLGRTAPRGFGEGERDGVALEPVIKLDQMKRYLEHLNEIRRINEGDDTGDSPGYTINLVRIPVSILPGKDTRTGYGAELTVTATPHLSAETLPQVFKKWVVNDLVDELTLPVQKYVDLYNAALKAKPRKPLFFELAKAYYEKLGQWPPEHDIEREQLLRELIPYQSEFASTPESMPEAKALHDHLISVLQSKGAYLDLGTTPRARRSQYSVPTTTRTATYNRAFYHWLEGVAPFRNAIAKNEPVPPASPSAILIEGDRLKWVAVRMKNALAHRVDATHDTVPMPDARKFLGEELKASYEFLVERGRRDPGIWELANGLAEIIHNSDDISLKERQKDFARLIGNGVPGQRSNRTSPYEFQVTEDLAWCVLVESALLNKQLIADMRRLAADKNANCVGANPGDRFYLPSDMLPPETVQSFNQYVKCRWPLKVFALDPVGQDQNVADAFSLRRELQLAASIAVASGQMTVGDFSQFARRIEMDAETIALNRTVTGFAHGDNTFGWRFQPRFQSPDVPGTLQSMHETLFGGLSRDSLVKQRRLEPGMRECVAIVVTPGFVPYVTFDTRTNWYRLDRPDRKKFDLRDNVKLSKEIVNLKQAKTACIADQHLYRDGEVYRLMRSVEQLEARLPLQTSYVQMPIEDSKGGFQTIASGTTNLGPELVGFYGDSGYNTKETSIFLVGDNFSVHDTRVIAGGKRLRTAPVTIEETIDDKKVTRVEGKQVYMLSRQILEVVLPEDLTSHTHTDGKGKVIDVQVATPYGISGVIEVPVVAAPVTPAETAAAAAVTAAVTKEVATHVAEHHPVAYEWKTPEKATASMVFGQTSLQSFSFNSPQQADNVLIDVTKDSKEIDALLNATSRTGQLAFKLVVADKDGKDIAKDIPVGIWDFQLGQKKPLSMFEAPISAALQKKLAPDAAPTEVRLAAYIRFANSAGQSDRSVLKLKKEWKIRITPPLKCPDNCPPACAPVTTPSAVVPSRVIVDDPLLTPPPVPVELYEPASTFVD